MDGSGIYKTFFITQIILILYFSPAFPQHVNNSTSQSTGLDSGEVLTVDFLKDAVKEAIKESDQEKEIKQRQLIYNLEIKLSREVEGWITAIKHSRRLQLNKLQHESWSLMGKVTYPVPYDYYLRDFNYEIIKSDIKSDSLVNGYKGIVNILEELYVEAPHSSGAAEVSKFFYTLSRIIVLRLEYIQETFVITDIEYEPFQIEADWQIDKLLKKEGYY